MLNGMQLDISKCDHGDPDEDFQLEIVNETPPLTGNPEFERKSDFELDAEIVKYRKLSKELHLKDGNQKLEYRLGILCTEQQYRNRKRNQEQTDCRESKSQATGGRVGKEDVQILNLTDDLASSNAPVSNGEGRGEKISTWSDNVAGPSQRPGLRSSSKYFARAGEIPSRLFADGTRSGCNPSRRRLTGASVCSSVEIQNTNFPRGGALGKKPGRRSRHCPDEEDSPEKVVELFSSEDEAETRTSLANDKAPTQKKSFGNRSNYVPSMEGLRIAYPSREDPEAVEVVYNDLRRLDPMEFLNDTVIDFYIKYLQRPEHLTEERKVKFYFFNTFFYKKLSEVVNLQNKKHETDLSRLRKWTKGTNIFEKEYLIIPIHDKWHWSLAIVCQAGSTSEDSGLRRYILHLDSMSPGHKSVIVFKLLRTYLLAEWKHQATKGGMEDRRHHIPEEYYNKKIPVPRQENESDCGLFLLHYIEKFINEAPSPFQMSDVEQGKLFGRNWFPPSRASGLRRCMQDLLQNYFEEEASKASAVRGPNKITSSPQHEVEKDGAEDGHTGALIVSDSKDASPVRTPESTLSGAQASATGRLQLGSPRSSTDNGCFSPEELSAVSGRTIFNSEHPRNADGLEERPRSSTDGRSGKSTCSPILQASVEMRSVVEAGVDGRADGRRESPESKGTNTSPYRDTGDGDQTDCHLVIQIPIEREKCLDEKSQEGDGGNDLLSSPMQTS